MLHQLYYKLCLAYHKTKGLILANTLAEILKEGVRLTFLSKILCSRMLPMRGEGVLRQSSDVVCHVILRHAHQCDGATSSQNAPTITLV